MSEVAVARTEIAGGIEAAIQGMTSAIGPIILFSGVLGAAALAAGYWAALVTAVVVAAIPSILRGNPALLSGCVPASLTVYTGIVFQLCGVAPGARPTVEQLAVGLGAGSLVLLMASLIVFASGLLRLGNLFRMIPAPVSSGIANGTALFLLLLALRQLGNDSAQSIVVCAMIVAGYALWPFLQRRQPRLALVPPVLVGAAIGIAAVWMLGAPAPQGDMPNPAGSWVWAPVMLWPHLLHAPLGQLLVVAVPGAVTLALVITLETFMTAGLMETRFGVQVDYNRELLVLGSANFLGALMGSVPSSASPARSLANRYAGGRGVLACVVFLLVSGVCLVGLANWLVALPAGIVAGLLVMQSHVMSDPLIRTRLLAMVRRGGRGHEAGDLGFWLNVSIALIGFLGNLVWATFAGIALSALIVLRRVSRNAVAHWEYLDQHRSVRVRNGAEAAVLARAPHRAGVLQLGGHLFFGNSFRIGQLADDIHVDARCAIIDLSGVIDADASGIAAVDRLARQLVDRDVQLMLTGLEVTRASDLVTALRKIPQAVERADLDRALEASEEQLLMHSTVKAAPLIHKPVAHNQLLEGLTQDEVDAVLALAQRRETASREWLFLKGEPSDGVWLLEEGAVSIHLADDESSRRLATFAPGQFIGEMSVVDGNVRSASALAETPVRAYLLGRQALDALLEHHPQAALRIMRNISCALSLRVRMTSALVAANERA